MVDSDNSRTLPIVSRDEVPLSRSAFLLKRRILDRLFQQQSNAATKFREKLDSGPFKCGDDTGKVIVNGRASAPFKIGNRLTRDIGCNCKLALAPA